MSNNEQYYTDSECLYLNSKLLDEVAQEKAKIFEKDKLTTNQLRRFYGEIKTLERRWIVQNKSEEEFKKIFPMIKLLKSKSDYAAKRDNIPKSFKDWLWDNIDKIDINNSKTFEAFLLYFEAIVGFCPKK